MSISFIKKLTPRLGMGIYYLPGIALAEIVDHPTNIIDSPEKVESLFNNVAGWFFTLFLIVAVIALIYTAFIYLTAVGDPKKITKARSSLTFAIVAIVIALLAGSMPVILQNLLESSTSGGGGDIDPSDPPGSWNDPSCNPNVEDCRT